MSHAVEIAMLAYINDLQRSIDLSETFADDVALLVSRMGADPSSDCARRTMLDLARRHRVDAIKARAKMEAIAEHYVRRFGAERFEQERSKHSARRRST